MTARAARRRLLIGCLLLTAGAVGCSQLIGGRSELRERRKFIIEAEPVRLDLPNSARPYQLRVQVERFSISRLYERDQITFRLTPEEIRHDRYNLWAVRPSEMITNAVTDYLRNARLFTDIREDFLDTTPDLTLTGSIDAIERFDSGDRWFARLAVTMQLVDRQNQIFWQHRFDPDEVEVYESEIVRTVDAMRDLMQQNMRGALRSLDRQLLIRKASLEGRDLTQLLAPENSGDRQETAPDTTEVPMETETYRIVPGKLVPEDR